MNMTMWSIFQVLKVSQLSKTEFSVSIQAQSPACFVWLVAKDVRGRFSENGFLLTEPTKVVCNYVYILRFKFDVDSSIKFQTMNNSQRSRLNVSLREITPLMRWYCGNFAVFCQNCRKYLSTFLC